MKPDRINYQKTFNLGNYCSERIGMEAQLDEGDNAEECLLELKKKVEMMHKVTNIPLEYGPIMPLTITTPQPIPSIDYKAKEEIEDAINDATSIEALAKTKEGASKYGLTTQYMDKLKSLTA